MARLERFVFEIRIAGDKSEGSIPGYRTEIEHIINVNAVSPSQLSESLATLVKAAAEEIIEALIERDEQAEKETEE